MTCPRKFFIMLTAGKAVDSVIESLLPYLDKEDIIMDGGNSFFKDTQRRYEYVTSKGFKYLVLVYLAVKREHSMAQH